MSIKYTALRVVTILLLLLACNHAFAALPSSLNYQGHLTDTAGKPVDGSVNISFAIYDVASGGTALWSETLPVTVEQGVFGVELGAGASPFPAGMFESPLWIGLSVAADAEMTPRRPISSVGFSFKSGDADTLEGISASTLDQSTHVNDTGNPHSVTAMQAGALSSAELETHAANSSSHHTKTTSFTDLTDTATDAQIPDNISIDQSSNADTVDGLNASSTPVAGRLLALSGGGKFPNSTLIMGPGSGLDADTVDGLHASMFSASSHAHNYLNASDGSPVNALFVDNIGRVGIGTASPAQELHVYGSNPRVIIEESATSNPELNFWSTGTSDWAIYKSGTSGDLKFYQGNDKLTLQNGTGNVGIGVVSPLYKLHVAGIANFELGGGSIAMSTPGGNPGMIAFAVNGNRRDMTIRNDGLSIAVSNTVAAPNTANGIFIAENGNVGFGTLSPGYRVDVNGRVRTTTLEITGGADLSEQFDINDDISLLEPLPGMVVSIDPEHEGALVVSDHAYNRRVAGVISGAGDVRPGMIMGHSGTVADGAHPVALTGRVYCFAETSGGAIEPGDLLTTSDVPGYAMKVADYSRAQGAIIGKAMTRLDAKRGQVLVLVSLQ